MRESESAFLTICGFIVPPNLAGTGLTHVPACRYCCRRLGYISQRIEAPQCFGSDLLRCKLSGGVRLPAYRESVSDLAGRPLCSIAYDRVLNGFWITHSQVALRTSHSGHSCTSSIAALFRTQFALPIGVMSPCISFHVPFDVFVSHAAPFMLVAPQQKLQSSGFLLSFQAKPACPTLPGTAVRCLENQ